MYGRDFILSHDLAYLALFAQWNPQYCLHRARLWNTSLHWKRANSCRNDNTLSAESQRDLSLPSRVLILQDSCAADTKFWAVSSWFTKHLHITLSTIWFQSRGFYWSIPSFQVVLLSISLLLRWYFSYANRCSLLEPMPCHAMPPSCQGRVSLHKKMLIRTEKSG